VEFKGMAGAVRFYGTGKTAVVGNEGKTEVRVSGKAIEGQGAFVVLLEGGSVSKAGYSEGAKVDVK
jgi:hypothetical protein